MNALNPHPARRPHGAAVKRPSSALSHLLALLLALLLGLGMGLAGQWGPAGGTAYGQAKKQARFYQVDELERLFEIARESGFSDEELHKITIEDGDKVINAWDYLQELKRKRALKEKEEQDRLARVYYSVQEIMAEMEQGQRKDLSHLRDKMIIKD